SIGGPSSNYPAYPGQWRQSAWALVARGARMVEYWHWHTLHYGAETYWGGVLPHSGRPGRAYEEIARLGAELARAGGAIADATPDADIAILSSTKARFALAAQPPLQLTDGSGDRNSYPRIVASFYRGAFDAGLQVRVVRPRYLFNQAPTEAARLHPVLVAAGYYTASDLDLDWLRRYAEAGGHLVVGPRTGYADDEARARAETQPARLSEPAGAWYDEFSNLDEPVSVRGSDAFPMDPEASATAWAECLVADGADILATYDHPHLGTWAAVTTRAYGAGRVTVVGTVPNQALARSLAHWLVPTPTAGWANLPDRVTVHTSSRPTGARVHILHNWSWEASTVTVPTDVEVLVAARGVALADAPPADVPGGPLAAGASVTLGPWDVLVTLTR
ncbi:beta-galactosidase, partial [Cellulomonas sp. P5_E12]